MSIITVRVSDELEAVLGRYCKEEDRSKSWLIKKALQEKLEDWLDYKAAVDALEEHEIKGGKTHSIESVARELGVTLKKKSNVEHRPRRQSKKAAR
ncbi:MAG: ribbon-helix-helix protein, CopG family [Proteobacteria bacterium]|nr:ribbon-helix-helix protein, CopG family [Pseudomonadota bacterium]